MRSNATLATVAVLTVLLTVMITLLTVSLTARFVIGQPTATAAAAPTQPAPPPRRDNNSGSTPGGWTGVWGAINEAIRPSNRPTQTVYQPETVSSAQPLYIPVGGTPFDIAGRPIGNAVAMTPWERDMATQRPMVTSVVAQQPLGTWQQIGFGSTTNPSDSEVVELWRRALDPNRNFYEYKVRNERGFEIPLDSNVTEIRNGQTFNVPGWDSKGPFMARITNSGYTFVYA